MKRKMNLQFRVQTETPHLWTYAFPHHRGSKEHSDSNCVAVTAKQIGEIKIKKGQVYFYFRETRG